MLYDVKVILVIQNMYNLRIIVEHCFYVIASYFILRDYSFIHLIQQVDNELHVDYILRIF